MKDTPERCAVRKLATLKKAAMQTKEEFQDASPIQRGSISPSPPPSPSSLSPQQLARIAQQKRLALSRRRLRQAHGTSQGSVETFRPSLAPLNWTFARCSQPIFSDCSRSPEPFVIPDKTSVPIGGWSKSATFQSENQPLSPAATSHGATYRSKQEFPEEENVLLKPASHSFVNFTSEQYQSSAYDDRFVIEDQSDSFQDALNEFEEGQHKLGTVENGEPSSRRSRMANGPEDECTDEEEELFAPLSTGEGFWDDPSVRYPSGRREDWSKKWQERQRVRYSPELSTPAEPEAGPLKFSIQQIEVLKAVAGGKSVFMTGAAGTGKSYVLHFVVRILQKWYGKEAVYVTASTGLAACTLRGTTLHSFGGVGLGTEKREILASKVLAKKDPASRWRNAKVLIIDEISMIDGELFDKLNYVAKALRDDDRAFGGIQLIVTGDFFQLPPVKPSNPHKFFAFNADCWDDCFDLQIELEHVFRQLDGGFVGMLHEIRRGTPTSRTIENLHKCFRVLPDDGLGITPTRLYPLKVDVKEENTYKMKALAQDTISFMAQDSFQKPIHKYMLDNMRAEKVLHLCIGAQIMLIKNLDTCGGLVNGARGVVVGFGPLLDSPDKDKDLKRAAPLVSPTNLWPIVRFACDTYTRTIGPQKERVEDRGMDVASRIQVPLILAWALSVHKCQGMTLDKVETDLSQAFEYGMVYVALSRVKDLNGLRLTGFDPSRIKVHPNVLSFYNKLAGNGTAKLSA